MKRSILLKTLLQISIAVFITIIFSGVVAGSDLVQWTMMQIFSGIAAGWALYLFACYFYHRRIKGNEKLRIASGVMMYGSFFLVPASIFTYFFHDLIPLYICAGASFVYMHIAHYILLKQHRFGFMHVLAWSILLNIPAVLLWMNNQIFYV